MGVLSESVLESERFSASFDSILRRSVLADLKAVTPDQPPDEVDWAHALLMASALQVDESDEGLEAALRIAQACLTDDAASQTHREAAVVLLERMGNAPAIRLARERRLVDADDDWDGAPLGVMIDVMRSRLELSIPLADGAALRVNRFQREFWTAAGRSDWVSASAPTSSGKSFIVRRILGDRLRRTESLTVVYLVPTRELIEEVSSELRRDFGGDASVFALPWDEEIDDEDRRVVVFTQERLHLLHDRLPEFTADLIFVDEAQKFSDGERGVLLQRVLDESVRRNPRAKILYASPLASNPELLLEGAPAGTSRESILSGMATVTQNLLWVNPVRYKPRRWTVELLHGGESRSLGTVELPSRPTNTSKRLSLTALALGREMPGNVVYVNGPAEAEKIALQLYDGLPRSPSARSATADLRELISATVHPDYALIQALTRGVAFHYGNMPLLIRTEIERLFKAGEVQYLVCTSTLLEGVNLPCRNLFVRGPRRGRGQPMDAFDFWNLAGRAGRWGKEFQGNIVCIDTSDEKQWPDPPRARTRRPIRRAVRQATSAVDALVDYIDSDRPDRDDRNEVFDAVFSLLAAEMLREGSLDGLTWLKVSAEGRSSLEHVTSERLNEIDIGLELISRHAGISPVGMQGLLTMFVERSDPEELLVDFPESDDAAASYVRALSRCDQYLGSAFGRSSGRRWQMAILIQNWMRGHPMARIINERVEHFRTSEPERPVARIIREAMTDVEQVARFQAPKYLSCYVDLLKIALSARGMEAMIDELPDVTMMLELGVSRQTELSLMSLGLSRATAISVGEYIVDDALSPASAREWLSRPAMIDALDLPALAKQEVEGILTSTTRTENS